MEQAKPPGSYRGAVSIRRRYKHSYYLQSAISPRPTAHSCIIQCPVCSSSPPPPHYLHWKTVWTESIYFANDAFHFLYSFDFLHVPTGWTPRWIIRLSDYIVSPPKCPRLRAIKVEYGLEQVPSTFQLNAVLFQFKNIDPLCVTNAHLSWFYSNVCLLETLTNIYFF